MIYEMTNGILTVRIKSLGAELISCQNQEGYEYIYQSTELWKGQAINMFPNVAMIKDDYILVDGKKYPAGQHGFAKDMEFEVCKTGDAYITFVLRSNKETKKYIPYDFNFFIDFSLDGDTIYQTFTVENISHETMYFGLGTHTGYIALEGSYLDFGPNGILTELKRKDMLYMTGECVPYSVPQSILTLKEDTYNHGADILTGFNEQIVTLKNEHNPYYVIVDFTGFQYLGLWAPADSQVAISIMPWCALPDTEHTSHNFEEKAGNVRLRGNDTFEATLAITCGKNTEISRISEN